MTRVLVLTPEYPPHASGIGNVVHAIASELVKGRLETKVLSRNSPELGTIPGPTVAPGLSGLLPFWQRASSYVARFGPKYDLVWMHAPVLLCSGGLAHARKVLVTIHTTYCGFYRAFKSHGLASTVPYYYLASRLEGAFFRDLSKQANVIVTAASPSVAEEACSNGLSLPAHVIPNGIESASQPQPLRALARADAGQRCGVELSSEDKVIVTVGRLTAQKQVGLLLKLYAEVNRRRPKTHLIVIGSGGLLSSVKKTASKIPNTHVLGSIPRSELLGWLNASDFFASLSCYEGLPLAVLEASAQGLPLILSDIPPHSYILSSHFGRGVLLSSQRPSVDDAIGFIDSHETPVEAPSTLLTELSWEQITRRYLDLVSA